jgi:IS5 family transposase
MAGLPGLFDVDERLKRLSDLGDQLLAFAEAVDFEIFRADLEEALGYSDGAQGGRPPFDPVLMFKILVIQAANNLSDERAEFLINDRLSFMRFLGLGLSDRVPDARTIWLFREKLTRSGDQGIVRPVRRPPTRFRLHSHVRADRRRQPDRGAQAAQYARREGRHQGGPHSRGMGEEASKTRPQGPRRTLDGEVHQGQGAGGRDDACGGHRHSRLRLQKPRLDRQGVRPDPRLAGHRRRPYDGARLREGLLDKTNTASAVWADTGYRSQANEDFMTKNGFVSKVHRKKPKGRPMPDVTRRANALKSKVRSHVEHVFAVQKDRMDLFIRTIGIARATTKIGMANIVYNIKRALFLRRTAAA